MLVIWCHVNVNKKLSIFYGWVTKYTPTYIAMVGQSILIWLYPRSIENIKHLVSFKIILICILYFVCKIMSFLTKLCACTTYYTYLDPRKKWHIIIGFLSSSTYYDYRQSNCRRHSSEGEVENLLFSNHHFNNGFYKVHVYIIHNCTALDYCTFSRESNDCEYLYHYQYNFLWYRYNHHPHLL